MTIDTRLLYFSILDKCRLYTVSHSVTKASRNINNLGVKKAQKRNAN